MLDATKNYSKPPHVHISSPDMLLNKNPKRKRHQGINFSTFLKLAYLNQKKRSTIKPSMLKMCVVSSDNRCVIMSNLMTLTVTGREGMPERGGVQGINKHKNKI